MCSKYPHSILPKRNYIRRLDLNELLENYPFLAVMRRCEDPKPFAVSATGKHEVLKSSIFGNTNLLQMSVNLIGGKYKRKHLRYNPKGNYVRGDWDGDTLQEIPVPKSLYDKKKTYGVIYYRISEVNKFTFPYTKVIKAEDYKNYKSRAEEIQRKHDLKVDSEIVGALGNPPNNGTVVRARIMANHHPNIMNYWHCQFDTYKPDSEEIVQYGENGAEAKRLRGALRDHLSRKAIKQLARSYHIRHKDYMDSVSSIVDKFDDLEYSSLEFLNTFAVSRFIVNQLIL